MTIQRNFAARVVNIAKDDETIIGLAVSGSWLTDELDAFSDLDLILVTQEKVSHDKSRMLHYAKGFGHLLSAFTGEHVGEPRLLICLYDNPLLRVDIKFLTPGEFRQRIETPVILLDKTGQLKSVLEETQPNFPGPDYQWTEDRFWTWVHYALLKIGRGEYVEAFDFSGFLRMVVLGPLLHIKNNNLPRGVRKVETQLPPQDFEQLKATLPSYSRAALLQALQHSVDLYRWLREALFSSAVTLQKETEQKVMEYFEAITQANEKQAVDNGQGQL